MMITEKRAAAQKAETDFFSLLKERKMSSSDLLWKDVHAFAIQAFSMTHFISLQVKRKISDDLRYEAVGSSSLREELFNTFLKAQEPNTSVSDAPANRDPVNQEEESVEGDAQDRKRQERKERAVREREEKIKAERGRVEADIGRSRQGLDREEGEREFRCALSKFHLYDYWWRSVHMFLSYRTMLTDAIRDPQVRLLR
jgi:heat shock protein beta